MESLSFSGSSKRAKAPSTSSIAQVVHCLVDGCNADLSVCRDYHRRHKVCETHSKTPKVTIGGREQRFCQQCSRFHSLTEFDEGKRSCRKRLDGHNRRRRKPQPDTLARSTSLLFPNQHTLSGTRLLSFSSPHILPSSMVSSWHGLVKPDNNGVGAYANRHQLMGSPTSHNTTFKGLNQLNPFQDSSLSPIGVDPNSNSSPKIYSEGPNHQVIDSDRALSLLSSQPTRDFSVNHNVVQTEAIPHAQSLVNDFNYNGLGPFHHQFSQDSKHVAASSSAEYQQHDSNTSTLHFPEMFQHGEGSSASGAHQTLSFMWE